MKAILIGGLSVVGCGLWVVGRGWRVESGGLNAEGGYLHRHRRCRINRRSIRFGIQLQILDDDALSAKLYQWSRVATVGDRFTPGKVPMIKFQW